jgi:four helix bundle protein
MAYPIEIYRETVNWPSDERDGLTSQIGRATTLVPLKIAEGAGNNSTKGFCRFLEMAHCADYEALTARALARGLDYMASSRTDEILTEASEIAAMIVGLMKALGWKSGWAQMSNLLLATDY